LSLTILIAHAATEERLGLGVIQTYLNENRPFLKMCPEPSEKQDSDGNDVCFNRGHYELDNLITVRGEKALIPCVLNKTADAVYWFFKSNYLNKTSWQLIRMAGMNLKHQQHNNTDSVTMENGTLNGNYSLIMRNLTVIMNGEYACVATNGTTPVGYVSYTLMATRPLFCSQSIEDWPCFIDLPTPAQHFTETIIRSSSNSLILPCHVGQSKRSVTEWWFIKSEKKNSYSYLPSYTTYSSCCY